MTVDAADALRDNNFIAAFQEIQQQAAAINQKNGFVAQEAMIDRLDTYLRSQCVDEFLPLIGMFKDARVGLKLALITGEISETLESVRKNLGPDDHIPKYSAEEAEIADAVLRLMNYATDRNLRLAEAIVAKNEFNRNRPDHSKEGRAAVHGKRF